MNFPKDLSGLLKRSGMLGYGERLLPRRDWHVLLGAAAILFLASVAWNVWFFLSLVGSDIAPMTTSEGQNALDRSVIEEVRAVRAGAAEEAARYQNEYRFTDPGK